MTHKQLLGLVPSVFQFCEWNASLIFLASTSKKYKMHKFIRNGELCIRLTHVKSVGYGLPFPA